MKAVQYLLILPCFCSLVILCAGIQNAHAQRKEVSGKVLEEKGQPLPGVTVSVSGTSNGTVTDASGRYSISNIKPMDTLLFTFLGMVSQKVRVGQQSVINVTMIANSVGLSEVVAIGYGTVKKSDLTGSVSSITGKELSSFPTTTPLMALEGRSAGVQVLQNSGSPGGNISVRIRGTNSILGNNEPLYVIDGFPISGSDPDILNNNDIQSIEVLKGASAEAIYGSRAANGVVLITTKRGAKGKTKVDLNYSIGYQKIRKELTMMDAKQYATLYNEQAANDGLSPYFTQSQIDSFGTGFNWQNLIFRTAPIKNYSLNISGGNDKTQFSINGGVFDQDGIIKNSNYKRYSVSSNIQTEISNKFSVDFSSVLTKINSSRQNSGGARFGASLISAALLAPPTLTPYNADGSVRVLSTYSFVSEGVTNPLNFINQTTNNLVSNQVLANSALIYKPFDGLSIRISGGIESENDRTDNYQTLEYYNSQGIAEVSIVQNTSLLNEDIISYNKSFGKNNISALAGFTYQDFITTSLGGSGTGFLSDVTETYGLGSAAIPGIPSSGYSKSVLLSYLGRINYSYNDKYLATVSLRSDGSSKFSNGDKWGLFPSIALAWRIKNENFLKDIPFISDLKIRGGWGATGSQAINAYATLNRLFPGQTVFGNTLYTTFAPSSTLPGNLKWETTEQEDLGVDLGILNNRVQMTVDYYNKQTKNLLSSVQLPPSTGYTSTLENVGAVNNHGVELSLTAHLLNKKLHWDVGGNISFNRNKVVKLYNNQDILGSPIDMIVFSDDISLIRVGQPMGVFYGYVENGYDKNGNIQYKDLNHDGTINQLDKTIIGNPNPKFIYGINTSLSFYGIGIMLFFQGTQGNDIANISSVDNSIAYGYGDNLLKDVYFNHWTSKNTNAKYPKITRNQSLLFSNRFIENGSYGRLRNIELSYTFPDEQKWGTKWINSLQLYISGQNLLTITKYSGWDPEVNSEGGPGALGQGIDYYTYPTAKSITFGVRAEF